MIKLLGQKKYAINTLWTISDRMLRMALTLFAGVLVARHLGAEQYGILSFAQSLSFVFGVFASLGVDPIVAREIAKGVANERKYICTAVWLKVLAGIAILPGPMVCAWLMGHGSQEIFVTAILAFSTIAQSLSVLDSYFQAKTALKYTSLAGAISSVTSSGLKIALVFMNASIEMFAIALVADAVLLSLALIYFYGRHSGAAVTGIRPDPSIALILLKESWPLILSAAMVSLYTRMDQVMISFWEGNASVGIYSAAVRISESWYYVPMAIGNSLFPSLVASRTNPALYYSRLKKLYSLMIYLGLSIAIPVTLLAQVIISLLYGSGFEGSASVLTIHVWGGVFVFIGVAYGKFLLIEGMTASAMLRTGAGAVVNLALNASLIPHYGIVGAAAATVFAQMMANMGFDLLSTKLREHFIMKLAALNPLSIFR